MTSATMQLPPNDVDWFLSGSITVDSGTLTINPGVSVFAEGADEYIYIANGGGINAVGTSSAPIVLSSNDDGESGGAEWGGLIIESMMSGGVAQRLQYVVVAEAGAEVSMSPRTYNANVSFIGEHEDTEVRFLQSHASGNDGVALLADGGDVNRALLESILVTSAQNDSVYFDHYVGLIKNLLVIQDSATGRAGIRGGGSTSNPLILNATLVGNDTSAASAGSEAALLFDNSIASIRMANALLLNYRNGCYRLEGGASFTGISLDSIDTMPDDEFLDAVHCVGEFDEVGDDFELSGAFSPLEGLGFPGSDGLRFYEFGSAANFSASASGETGSWYLESISFGGEFENGTTELNRYNSGDTNNNNDLPADDENDAAASPLLGFDETVDPLYVGVDGAIEFLSGFGNSLAPGELWLDESTFEPLDPQPGEETFLAGPVQRAGTLFNLTVIGAIESATDDRFDDWTIDSSF